MNYNKRNLYQERLAKEDIRLLIKCVEYSVAVMISDGQATDTRLVMLIGKLKRMEKQ